MVEPRIGRQHQTARCDCGTICEVSRREASAWEFDWQCRCGRVGTISWAHSAPPPDFIPRKNIQLS